MGCAGTKQVAPAAPDSAQFKDQSPTAIRAAAPAPSTEAKKDAAAPAQEAVVLGLHPVMPIGAELRDSTWRST